MLAATGTRYPSPSAARSRRLATLGRLSRSTTTTPRNTSTVRRKISASKWGLPLVALLTLIWTARKRWRLPSGYAADGRHLWSKVHAGSHRLYVADAEIADRAAVEFDDPNKEGEEARMLELRVGGGGKGAQTVFPAVGPQGHRRAYLLGKGWRTGPRCWTRSVARCTLIGGVLFACPLLAGDGSGCHEAALAVGGFLRALGWTRMRSAASLRRTPIFRTRTRAMICRALLLMPLLDF